LRELEPLHPLFVEEPVLPEQWESYRYLADATSIPLAAGERMYSRFDFKPVLAAGGLAILQPDLSHAGGITECVKIAAMAEAHDVALAPHCPLGPVALAACLQVDFVAHNAILQEQSIGIHYNEGAHLLDYVLNKDDFRCIDGSIAALPKPGLGVEIDEERLLQASRNPPGWRNPIWRHTDGSIAEW
jgi:galactonate dehydratase